MTDDDTAGRVRQPFPVTANASGQPVDPDLAVHTPAVTTATALFDAFLRGGQQGEVLAVIGGAGTGSSTLSGVLRGMADQAQPPVRSFYAQVSATSFQGVLGSFVRAAKRDESTVRAGVRHLFAQVVADALGDSDSAGASVRSCAGASSTRSRWCSGCAWTAAPTWRP